MISNAPGTVADITYENYRALAISVWSIAPLNGPATGTSTFKVRTIEFDNDNRLQVS